MVNHSRILIAWGAIALLATTAFGQGYRTRPSVRTATQPQAKTVKIWRGGDATAAQEEVEAEPEAAADEPAMPPLPATPEDREVGDDRLDAINGSPFHAPGGCQDGFCGKDGCSGGGCGADGCCGDGLCGACCTPFWAYRTGFFAEYLYLNASDVNMAHAIQQNGVGGLGTVPDGSVGVLDPRFESGYRTGFAWALDPCSSVGATYTNYRNASENVISAPDVLGGTVASLVLHPETVNAGSTSSLVGARLDVDFQTVDINYRRMIAGGCQHALNYTIGVRYGNLQQQFFQVGEFAPPLGTLVTSTNIKFESVGLRTGLDGQRRVGMSGFSVYGNAFINVLFGEVNSSYTQLDTTSTIVQATSNWSDDRVVPVLEYEVGVRWMSRNGRWVVSNGYYTAFWFNTVTTSQYVQAVQNANFVDLGETISFNGFTSRVEFRF